MGRRVVPIRHGEARFRSDSDAAVLRALRALRTGVLTGPLHVL